MEMDRFASGRQKRSSTKCETPEDYVSVTVAFSIAVNKPQREPYSYESVRDGKIKRIYENLLPGNYFRIQYQLLPCGKNQVPQIFKMDVVIFGGVISKVYTERYSRVIQYWSEPETEEQLVGGGEAGANSSKNIFSWRHKHKFSVNKANILELFQHVVEVRLWSSIKKVSTYARHDRPKAFRLFPESLPSGERKRLSQYPLVSHDLIQTHWGKSKITNMASKQLKEEDSFLSLLSVESYDDDGHNARTPAPADIDSVSNDTNISNKDTPTSYKKDSSSKDPLNSASKDPLNSSSKDPLKSSNNVPSNSSSKDPLNPSSNDPLIPSSNDPLIPSNNDPFNPSSKVSPNTSNKDPQNSKDPFSLSSKGPQNLSNNDPLNSSSNDPLNPSSKDPPNSSNKDPPNSSNKDPLNSSSKDSHGNEPSKTSGSRGKQKSLISTYHGHSHISSMSPKKQERSTKRQHQQTSGKTAEQTSMNKDGHVVLRLKMSELFGKNGFIQAKMESTMQDVMGFEVIMHSTVPLIPDHLVKELRPMIVTVEKVTGLPSTPMSHQQLSEKCAPVYVQYQFPEHSPHRVEGLPRSPTINFHNCNVILLGTIEHFYLLEFLHGPPLTFELHDRECDVTLMSSHTMFGEDSCDEFIGTQMFGAKLDDGISTWCREDTRDRKNIYPCPYGIASFDLSRLLTGEQLLEMTVPVHRSPRTPSTNHPLSKFGSDQIQPGNYIESGCEMTVTFELYQPLTQYSINSGKSPQWGTGHFISKFSPQTQVTCLFNRLIYIISYSPKGRALIDRILSRVNEINALTLGLEYFPSDVLPAALSTYKLTKEQLVSNVLTGFHVEDSSKHIVILEGLKDQGVNILWEECPRHHSQDAALLKAFYNSEFNFSNRLYGTLDVDFPRIVLCCPLRMILQRPLIYVQGSVPQACFRALTCLSWLELVDDMMGVTRNSLLPTAEEVASLSLHFSLPAPLQATPTSKLWGEEEMDTDSHHTPQRPKAPLKGSHMTRGRMYVSMVTTNPDFDRSIRKRRPTKDFVKSNIEHCVNLSDITHCRNIEKHGHYRSHTDPGTLPHLTSPIYNYSTQACNTAEIAMNQMRECLGPRRRYTFCNDYLHRSIIPLQRQKKRQKNMWHTKEKFVYPGVSSSLQSNKHPMKPDPARQAELAKPFQDNLLHRNKLLPTVDRLHFSATDRKLDFDRWTPPHYNLKGSFNVLGEKLLRKAEEEVEQEEEERRRREREDWEEKVVVDDMKFHTYRVGIKTELSTKAATKVDTLQGLLKDPPQKLSLCQSLPLDVPPLGVVQYPNLDPNINFLIPGDSWDFPTRGFLPGPYRRSLKLANNCIPCQGWNEEFKSSILLKPPSTSPNPGASLATRSTNLSDEQPLIHSPHSKPSDRSQTQNLARFCRNASSCTD